MFDDFEASAEEEEGAVDGFVAVGEDGADGEEIVAIDGSNAFDEFWIGFGPVEEGDGLRAGLGSGFALVGVHEPVVFDAEVAFEEEVTDAELDAGAVEVFGEVFEHFKGVTDGCLLGVVEFIAGGALVGVLETEESGLGTRYEGALDDKLGGSMEASAQGVGEKEVPINSLNGLVEGVSELDLHEDLVDAEVFAAGKVEDLEVDGGFAHLLHAFGGFENLAIGPTLWDTFAVAADKATDGFAVCFGEGLVLADGVEGLAVVGIDEGGIEDGEASGFTCGAVSAACEDESEEEAEGYSVLHRGNSETGVEVTKGWWKEKRPRFGSAVLNDG